MKNPFRETDGCDYTDEDRAVESTWLDIACRHVSDFYIISPLLTVEPAESSDGLTWYALGSADLGIDNAETIAEVLFLHHDNRAAKALSMAQSGPVAGPLRYLVGRDAVAPKQGLVTRTTAKIDNSVSDARPSFRTIWPSDAVLSWPVDGAPGAVTRWLGPVDGASTRGGWVCRSYVKNGERRTILGSADGPIVVSPSAALMKVAVAA